MKRLAFLLGVLVALWCVPASANWLKGCRGMENILCSAATTPWACCTGAATGTCAETGQLTRELGGTGKIACHHPNPDGATAQAPDPIQVSDCDQVDMFWYADYDGDGADSAGQAAVYTCPSTASAAYDADGDGNVNAAADWRLMCQPLDVGIVLTAANSEAIGWAAMWLWFDVTANDDDAELLVKCNVGPE